LPASTDQEALLAWYAANKRDLPWRASSDPYRIWVSEIMLQQTQVATVLPYYSRWLERFPTVDALAAADEQDVLSVWQGLGYYRRGKMLLAGARWIVAHGMPKDFRSWLAVPGVGRYTAGAISSIAFGEPVPVVDGNVERVFARITGFDSDGGALNRAAWDWAQHALAPGSPGDWNQAMMELGATVCRPKKPLCETCPFAGNCVARREGRQAELPSRVPRSTPKRVDQIANVFHWEDSFGLELIPEGEWWSGLWRFPTSPQARAMVGEVRHVVTNHRVKLEVRFERAERPLESLRWCSLEELKHLPMPAPQRRALQMCLAELTAAV
jgi:A/G-specific adenine glycosylase